MAQSASPRAGAIFRKLLIVGGVVVGVLSAWVIFAAIRQAMRSEDFQQKLLLSAMDKLVLGGVIVFVGYLVQKQLEIFKRDQALTSELAKARIAAYNRAFAAVGAFDSIGGVLLLAVLEEPHQSPETMDRIFEEFGKANGALIEVLRTDRYLLGYTFAGAVTAYTQRIRDDVQQALSETRPSAEEQARRKQERFILRNELNTHLPPFARIPEDDLHFSSPDIGHAYIKILEETQQRSTK
jgi:hypothetical protein